MAVVFGLMILILAVTRTPAHADEVPECWGPAGVMRPGSFTIEIETEFMSKSELVQALGWADGRYIRAQRYPLVFGVSDPADDPETAFLSILVQAQDPAQGTPAALTEKAFRAAVRAELKKIAALPGVHISCNYVRRALPETHRPGVGVHN